MPRPVPPWPTVNIVAAVVALLGLLMKALDPEGAAYFLLLAGHMALTLWLGMG